MKHFTSTVAMLRSTFFALLSIFLFTTVSAQSVTLTHPNGGEILFACQQYNVTWAQTGSPSNYWNIDYSLDGGTIWTSVASNYLSANGSFMWTVPSVQSNTVIMRVFDSNAPSTVDQSNNVFTINIPVILTSPNGGEVWQAQTVHNITWNIIGTSNSFNLSYSTNNGSTWNTIVNNYSTGIGTYAWTIPAMAQSSQCLVRVMDATQNCMQDVSNNVFTITPATPIMTSPNGGEQIYPYCGYDITWNQNTYYSNVRIDYSIDGGATWTVVTSSTTNDGVYNWGAPMITTTQGRIKVSHADDPTLFDTSNANFTLLPIISITTPTTGTTWTGCSTYNITFNKASCLTSFNIYYSTNNGSSWNYIVYQLNTTNSTTQTYSWQVPNGINTSQALIKVEDYNNSTRNGVSNTFSIIPSADITVTSPNGGESFASQSIQPITWTNTANTSGQYMLQYSINNGSSWTTIASNVTGNSYNWTVANASSSQCLVQVIDVVNNCKMDVSNATFTITGQTPTVISPNGGEQIYPSCSYNITWNQNTFYSNVRIDYSTDGGATWALVTSSTTNDGSHSWTVPTILTSQGRIKVSQANDLSITDTSDANFSILPMITVNSPSTGTSWIGCSTYPITFTKPGCLTVFAISYSVNNGSTWSTISSQFNTTSANTQTYNWQVPNTVNSAQVIIRVADYNNSSNYDWSEPFTITPSADVTITSPNGGESWASQSVHQVTWTNTAQASGQYYLQYSTNNGSSWSNIASNIVGNAYNWTVPNTPGTQCLVRVLDQVNDCKADASDAVFTITGLTPVMLSPNGGEQVYAYCDKNITWDDETFYGSVRLDYSNDGGSTWTLITSSTTNDGSFPWSVPLITGNQFRIKVSQVSDLTLFDISDANFTVLPVISVSAPTTGTTWTGCSTYPITFSKGSCLTSFNIFYSVNNGSTWNYVVYQLNTTTANTQTYNWQVPNGLNSTQALIKVEDFNSTSRFGTSALFTIVPSADVTITSPNGGESWASQSVQPITWSNTANASGQYNLQYSINNGSSWTTIVNNITGNSYNWTVANASSTQCLVKVIDAVNTCKEDVSNATFSITGQTPTVMSPNGGEQIYPGCSYTITWNQSTYYSNVRIDYSTDGGTTWSPITTSTTNDGTHSWTVPVILTSQGRVKVSQVNDLTITDISDGNFNILAPITVNNPSTGTTLTGCSTYPITFTKSSCYTAFTLSYSVDNGVNWSNIVSNYNTTSANTQTYNWVVPNINFAQVLIRVAEYNNSSNFDWSEPFAIVPSMDVTMIFPNGGEEFQSQSVQQITWSNTAQSSGQFTLQYSTNSGSSWTNIVTNIVGNAYNWTVPNIPASQCLVQVIDAVNTCKTDASDAVFTITGLTPHMLSPNGGEQLYGYCDKTITWDDDTFYGNVRIDYSTDGGTSWNAITSSTSNDGSMTWSVPTITGNQFRIKVSQVSDLTLFDISDENFSILPVISVNAPVAGSTLVGCTTVPITFSKGSCITSFNIFYSINNGATWSYVVYQWNTTSANSQTYNWIVPNGINTTQALIKVEDYNSTSRFGTSSTFTIESSADITITSPNGGEVFAPQSVQTITWTNTPQTSGQYMIEYSINNGTSWTTIVTNLIGNAYNWTVPNAPGIACLVRVTDMVSNCKLDVSNSVFTILPLAAQVLSPNGGEILYAGTSHSITWNSNTYYTNVRIDYSTDGGLTWISITPSTSNDGNHSWTVPQLSSGQCLVKVSSTDLTQFDVSDAFFTIKPAVTILTPNGDNGVTVWGGCTVTSITFDRSPAYTTYKIEYSVNNGTTWTTIISSWTASTNPATYNWTMPNIPTSQALVRVSPTTATSSNDVSDATFSITKPVTIIQPNFGGTMQVGTTYNIQWTSDGISNIYDIFYSTNGGTSFTNIVTGYNTSNNTYQWLVPNIPSSNCQVWVRDNINSCKSDTSDVAFVISPTAPPLTITSPNGILDTLTGCSMHTITWTETSTFGTYDISYSLNNGSTWVTVVTGYATNSHSYNWVVPNTINSSNVLVRVRPASSPTSYDLTDAYITIHSGSLNALPENTTVCSNTPVQLNVSGGTNYSWAPTTGLNFSNIPNPVATPPSTTTYTVSSDVGGCVLSDQVTITVTQSGITASVSIAHDGNGTLCQGQQVTFIATPQNGGNEPHYQWKVNSTLVGTDSPVFTTTALNDNDIVTCVLTSNMGCVSGSPATSNTLLVDVQTSVVPSVSISSASGNDICAGQQAVFTAVSQNGGGNPSYQWTINDQPVGNNSNQFSNAALQDGDVVNVTMTSAAVCVTVPSVNAQDITMNVSDLPAQPSPIAGDATLCAGETASYSVPSVPGATSYSWTLPQGWSGSSLTNSISVIPGSAGGQVSVSASNGCGNGLSRSLNIDLNQVPLTPGIISGLSNACENSTQFYSISPIAGATSYEWDAPAGWTINGSGEQVEITFASANTSGSIEVRAVNECGTSQVQVLPVTIQVYSTMPSVISGPVAVCEGSALNYSVTAYPGAVSYTWTLPASWSGTSITNSISSIATNLGGQVMVVANTNCGTSPARTLDIFIEELPEAPASINGPTEVCEGAPYTYASTGTTIDFEWQVPAGWNISGSGSSVIVTPGNTAGAIHVASSNSCGTSSFISLDIEPIALPSSPSSVSGESAVCEDEVNVYTVSPVIGADYYVWQLPQGWNGSGTSTSIQVTSGSADGTIMVAAANECGSSGFTSFGVDISPLPQLSPVITGPTVLCSSQQTAYSVDAAIYADGYEWNLPSGWEGSSTEFVINATAGTSGGTISIVAVNECGSSSPAILGVIVTDNAPVIGSISGNEGVCANGEASYAVADVAEADNYEWTIPQGWQLIDNGNSSVDVLTNDQSGSVSVIAMNGCGSSTPQSFEVDIWALPEITAAANPSFAVCIGDPVTLNGQGGSNYQWTLGVVDGVSFIPEPGVTYQVTGTGDHNCTNTATISVLVNALPTVALTLSGEDVQCLETTSLVLAGGNPAGGEFSGEGVVNDTFYPSVAGVGVSVITYEYTDANGCTNDTQDVYTVEICGGVEESDALLVELYPNPTTGLFTLEWSAGVALRDANATLEVYDATGRVMFSSLLTQTKEIFDLGGLASGHYVVRVINGNNVNHINLVLAK